MINDVRNAVMFIINKDNSGYISPEEFNSYAKLAQMDIFSRLMENYNDWLTKRNARTSNSGIGDVAQKYAEDIESFIKEEALTLSGGVLPLPADFYSAVYVLNNGKVCEKVSGVNTMYVQSSGVSSLLSSYTMYEMIGNSISVIPSSAQSNTRVRYVRMPVDPKWTYYTDPQTGSPLFDISNPMYQDFELSKDHFVELTYKVLKLAGLTIREEEVIAAITRQETLNAQGVE